MLSDLIKQAQIWCHGGLVILTDPPGNLRRDAVFPLCQENIIFIESLDDLREGEAVLDLCSGSGVLALFAALKGANVVAVDNNPRAIEFIRANVTLNGMENRITVHEGDLFEGLDGRRFQWITANPPFEPTGPATTAMHSDGGPEGVTITRRILREAPDYLAAGGILKMTTYLPSDFRTWSELTKFEVRHLNEIGTAPPRPRVNSCHTFDEFELDERLVVSLISLELRHGGISHA